MPADTNISKETRGGGTAGFLNEEPRDSTTFARMYYEHQYDRMSKLEDQELAISNIVLGISMVAFTFGFASTQGLNVITGIGLPVIVVAANIFAILYFRRASDYIRTHRKRAKHILELYAERIYKIDQAIRWRAGFWSGWRIQMYLHILLILVALLPIYVYLRSVL